MALGIKPALETETRRRTMAATLVNTILKEILVIPFCLTDTDPAMTKSSLQSTETGVKNEQI